MKAPWKIPFYPLCLLVLVISTLFNLLFLVSQNDSLSMLGLLGVSLCGTVLSKLILEFYVPRFQRYVLIALPVLVTVLSVVAMVFYCRSTNQQPVCAQSPLLLSIVPMSIAYILVGGEYFGKFLVWASLQRQARLMNGKK